MSTPSDLDTTIHSPKRLAAMAVLASSQSTDFAFLKNHLGLADSDLSKQMTALRDAGYVTITKTGHGRSGQTTYAITKDGQKAFKAYREHLRSLMGD